jgi:hypothetical protein
VEVAAAPGQQVSPAIVLRLREPQESAGPGLANSNTELADCLSTRPDMKLRVQVELIPDNGNTPVWTGHYVAGAQDLLALKDEVAAGAGAGCRELVAARPRD